MEGCCVLCVRYKNSDAMFLVCEVIERANGVCVICCGSRKGVIVSARY